MTSLTSQATSVWRKKAHEYKWKVYLMLRNAKVKPWPGSLHITDSNTCLRSRNPQSKTSGIFFLPLELTFTLAVNETKQRSVIRVNVFIQGFYRKLISWGMQSCAKLIGGSWHSCKEAVASEYVFTFTTTLCQPQEFQIKLFTTWIIFQGQMLKKKLGCGLAPWKPAKVTLKLVIQRLTGLDVSTSKVPSGKTLQCFDECCCERKAEAPYISHSKATICRCFLQCASWGWQ